MKDSENGRVRSEMGMLKAIICEVRDRLATKTKILYIFLKSLKKIEYCAAFENSFRW